MADDDAESSVPGNIESSADESSYGSMPGLKDSSSDESPPGPMPGLIESSSDESSDSSMPGLIEMIMDVYGRSFRTAMVQRSRRSMLWVPRAGIFANFDDNDVDEFRNSIWPMHNVRSGLRPRGFTL